MGRIRSENWMGCSRCTRAMSAREPSFQEYTGWGCTQAIPTSWDRRPGFPSFQAPSSTENWDGLFRVLEEREKGTESARKHRWPEKVWGWGRRLENCIHKKAHERKRGFGVEAESLLRGLRLDQGLEAGAMRGARVWDRKLGTRVEETGCHTP